MGKAILGTVRSGRVDSTWDRRNSHPAV